MRIIKRIVKAVKIMLIRQKMKDISFWIDSYGGKYNNALIEMHSKQERKLFEYESY